MKIGILGGGSAFALNLANLCADFRIGNFGIGRSAHKTAAFWVVQHHYRYWQAHIVEQLPTVMAVLDTERPDVIVNIAAQGEGAASFDERAPDFYRTNTYGLARLVESIRTRDYVKRFVHIGTSELYGSVEAAVKEDAPLKPSSPYAISKAAFDQHLITMHKVHGFPMNIIRPSNAYCPGQQLHRIIPKAIVCALSGKKLPLQGGGKAQKSYMHATDLSRAILAVLDKGVVGEIYNCGPLWPISIGAVVQHVAEACGISYDELVEEVPDRVGQDGKYHIDSTKLRNLGWIPKINLVEGIKGMVEWIRDYPELLTTSTAYEHKP